MQSVSCIRPDVLQASDNDSGENARLTYRLEGDGLEQFAIGEESGVLTLAQALDRESTPEYHLLVIATDHGEPPLSATATVDVLVEDGQ